VSEVGEDQFGAELGEEETELDRMHKNLGWKYAVKPARYRSTDWNHETVTQFGGDECKMKLYASREQVTNEIARRAKEIEEKVNIGYVEEAEGDFPRVA